MTLTKIKSDFQVNEKVIEIDNPAEFKWIEIFNSIQKSFKDKYIVKINLVKLTKAKLFFDVVYLDNFNGVIDKPFLPISNLEIELRQKDISCLIIPTGVGAAFGGYAGDANPIAKLLAANSEYLITHPNVVNGAVLSDVPSNLVYLEGFLLDQFLIGKISIIPTKQNKIGVIFDNGISQDRLEYEVNVLEATRVFYGCDVAYWTLTEKPLSVSTHINEYGFSSGHIKNLQCVIEKALKLKELGVTAIAIVTAIPDSDSNEGYKSGVGIDPIGGVESIISRVVSASTGLVSAHAPVLISEEENINYRDVSPLSASEYIAKTFLPSVISGLRFAPRIIKPDSLGENKISFLNLNKVIVPQNAFGSPGVFFLNEVLKNVVLVQENKTSLDVDLRDLNIQFKSVDSYLDLISIEKVNECGIDKNVLKRPVGNILKV